MSLDDLVLQKDIGRDKAEEANTAAFIASPERSRREEEKETKKTIENKSEKGIFLY